MLKKKPKYPQRPKTRRWFPPQGQKWLKLEPARLAPIGGLFFAACSMLLYLVRLLTGQEIEPQQIVVSVAATFLVSYAGTGFFVWYMLRTAENELDQSPSRTSLDHESSEADGYDTTEDDGRRPDEFEENP